MLDQTISNSKSLHCHQIKNHSRWVTRLSGSAGSVVHEKREGAYYLFLLVDNQRTTRTNTFHMGKRFGIDLFGTRQHAESEHLPAPFRIRRWNKGGMGSGRANHLFFIE